MGEWKRQCKTCQSPAIVTVYGRALCLRCYNSKLYRIKTKAEQAYVMASTSDLSEARGA